MAKDNPNPPDPKQPGPNQDDRQDDPQDLRNDLPAGKEIEDFFQRLPGTFRWPKPNAEAVAAAEEAIHRMSGGGADRDPAAAGDADEPGSACSACGGALPSGARFCVWCGISAQDVAGAAAAPSRSAAGQHHVHHHYHHFVPGPVGFGKEAVFGASEAEFQSSAPYIPRGRAPVSGTQSSITPGSATQDMAGTGSFGAGPKTAGRAEISARQVVQDWAQACNTRHIDDLLELYAPDATLIRSSVPPVRSLPAIREFLISLLEAGLGDVEMESLRVDMMGDIALDLGRCKMLVPVAMGKRREERGKYLIVLVRQPAGTWKILADCWSADLAVSAPPESAPRKASEPTPPVRKTR
jgi:ketosteroid isomerase-like protein